MAPRDLNNRVHRIMIVLDNARPQVWRRVEVPSVTRLSDLHELIQTVMDWEDMHLHVFEFSGRSYSDDLDPGLEPLDTDESAVRVGDVLRRKASEGTYTYDLGDEWLHTLTVEKISDADTDAVYPRLLGGQGGPPPEDCGGVGAFDHLRHLRAHPEEIGSAGGEGAEELRFWVQALEPDDLDLESERQYLREAFGTLALEEEPDEETGAPPAAPARPVSLPSEEELARAASGTEIVDELLRLARWFTPARKLTGTGMPRPADVRTVVEEQGLLRPFTENETAERNARLEKLRAARDLPGFLPLWSRAVGLGLIEVGSSSAHTAPEVAEGLTAARTLDLWTDVFEEVVESEPDGVGLFQAMPDECELLLTVLRMLYEAPDESDIDLYELVEPLLDSLVEDVAGNQELSSEDLGHLRLSFRQMVYRGALRLSLAGALALTDRTPAKVSEECQQGPLVNRLLHTQDTSTDPGIDCSAVLTPLGRYGVRQILLREGVPAPLRGHLAEAGAAALLDTLVMAAPENHREEFAPWLERHSTADAVGQIVGAAAEGPEASALRRTVAQEVLTALGDQGLEELRGYLSSEHTAVAGSAAGALLASGTCSEEESQRLLSGHGPWLAIDMAAAPMELAEPLESGGDEQLSILLELLTGAGSGPGVLGGLLLDGADRLWRSDHPATVPVLQALGRVHPDKKGAKAARRAAHKAQSRG